MLYLVDGYNVTHRDPATSALSLLEQREALVARLRTRGQDLLGRGRVVVVFDGQEGPGLSAGGGAPVEIVYAQGRSADDEIVRIAAKQTDSVVVVSSDRDLCDRVKAHGARVETRDSSCCFEASGETRRRSARSRRSLARDAGLPRGANEITRELKDLWLEDE
jgi:predicted RNA-binding protein with PIN domain